MVYNPSLTSIVDHLGKPEKGGESRPTRLFARVVDIVLDESHPDYELYGKELAINGIRYRLLSTNSDEEEQTSLPFAYAGDSNIKHIPLVDEIVEIIRQPDNSIGSRYIDYKNYYIRVANLWNNSHHNALPDITVGKTEAKLGENAPELSNISALQPFTGDTYIEGRLGQSLRFTGYAHPKNSFTTEENNGSPLVILRVGQREENDPFVGYVENINEDPSSIYISTNHTIPLETELSKQDTYRSEKPTTYSKFQGNQVVVSSGRLVFHAKEDNLLFNSSNSLGIVSRSTNIDSTEYISLDSPSIYLGANAQEPVVRGNKNEELLRELLNLLTTMGNNFVLATNPVLASTQLVSTGAEMIPKVQSIIAKLESLKSKKVFTE